MANDVSGPVAFRAMERMGAERVFDASRVVMVADHFVPAKDAKSAELQARLQRWAEEKGVVFYGQGRGGIEHALLCEEGWVVPGAVIAGGDSHTCTYGALGAFGTGLGSTDIASCLALGSFWQAVPETILVELRGAPGSFVTGKDIILAVLARIGVGGGTNAVLEFGGPGADGLSLDERLAVANMAVEAGSETGNFPADERVEEYLDGRARFPWTAERSDPDASFRAQLQIDLASLEPLVARPHLPGNVAAVGDVSGTRVDQVYIGNCANGTMTDLRQAASILGGAVSTRERGPSWCRRPRRSGARPPRKDCSTRSQRPARWCRPRPAARASGGSNGVLAAGENAVATTNRNFRGRMGSPQASVYLANAWVAAAAAVAGEIVRPRDDRVTVEGTALLVPGDNVDTDVMYPGGVPEHRRSGARWPRTSSRGYDPTLRERLDGRRRSSSSARTSGSGRRGSTCRSRCRRTASAVCSAGASRGSSTATASTSACPRSPVPRRPRRRTTAHTSGSTRPAPWRSTAPGSGHRPTPPSCSSSATRAGSSRGPRASSGSVSQRPSDSYSGLGSQPSPDAMRFVRLNNVGHLGDVHDVLVRPACVAEGVDVRLGHLVGSER